MTTASVPSGAILQRDKQTYAIVPRLPGGLLNIEILQNLALVVEKYQIPLVKITSGQRVALIGMPADQLDAIWHDLGLEAGKATELCLHYVQTCPGTEVCTFGVQDSLAFGLELEEYFSGKNFPAKVKIGVSGCPFSCSESLVRDIGITGKKKGWTVTFGGSSTRNPRAGDVLAENITSQEVKHLLSRCLDYYAKHAKKKERTSRFIDRIGLENFKKVIL
ncbi:MAG: NAD(P)/FAD-dependent oxidoreductase [Deltaproteobacteria bacterium]|nr:NAD(P)/FAD-dependent oxidoreductase [Deltaproteobacteria bacterium]